MFLALTIFCALSFLGYGVSCLATEHMVREFDRYGLARYRKPTGILQPLAAVGLIAGLRFPWIGALAAGGLALQMLLGFGVRLRIRDPLPHAIPALAYLLISGWLCFQFLGQYH